MRVGPSERLICVQPCFSTVSGQSAKVKVPEIKKWTAKNCPIKLDGSKGQKTVHFYPDSREPPISIKLEDWKKLFFANFKMMGWDRLKIWEWVKDALAISKIRIDSWFTRLSIGRLNNTFLDFIMLHYTNIIESFPLCEDLWWSLYDLPVRTTALLVAHLLSNDGPLRPLKI